ncbi:MAG: cell division protein ZapA, partial [Acidobacteria bacterium]|nr:cell division protein ZapA [Acidobacteriota bacterium]
MPDADDRVVPVEILGQRYPIRSALDDTYVTELATYVDNKIRSAAEATPTSDMVRVACLL